MIIQVLHLNSNPSYLFYMLLDKTSLVEDAPNDQDHGMNSSKTKERRTKLGIVSIKIVEDDDGREVFEGKEGCSKLLKAKRKGKESTDSILSLGNASMHGHIIKPMDA
ncbi:hypothetical protein MTR_3g107620 [Medicago truncatula]|uniref:Uncharacterized protein n=1 Tax=Medicago truncatula TaxID=3880 RepID=G7JB52_MEDTR|nr:hypothetical protein MTR_3g107620 [Medicago truncatula]